MNNYLKSKLPKMDKDGVKIVANEIVEAGTETIKQGILSTASALLLKVIMGAAIIIMLVVGITSAGCIGTSVAIEKLTEK